VRELALLLRDFPESPPSTAGSPLPRLPALERWLAQGSVRPAPSGWRGWLVRALLGVEPDEDGAGAGWAARGLLPQAAGRYFWFATPVHYLAGLDTVHVPPAGLLRLAPDVQQTLAAEFARDFRDPPWRLHALGFRELLLEGPDPGSHRTAEVGSVVGGDLHALQPRGGGVRPLRQLAAEVELWLHEQPLNRAREARHELAVSGLWFWGGSRAASLPVQTVGEPQPPRAWRLHADDVFSAGVAAAAGSSLRVLPATAAEDCFGAASSSAVVLPAELPHGTEDLVRLERDWFVPLLAGLAAGRWSELMLVRGTRGYLLRRAHAWRRWRRTRPWWENLWR